MLKLANYYNLESCKCQQDKEYENVTFAGVVCQSPISSTFSGPEKQMALKAV